VKRALVNVLRVVLTLGFLWLALRMVRLDDTWIVEGPDGRKHVAVAVAPGRAVLENGTELTTTAEPIRREGFRSIVGRLNPWRLAGLAALLVVPVILMSVRWHLLMKANGFEVAFGRVFVVNYAGSFFNLFLPGGVGGDIAKGVMTASGEERKAAAVGTILLDRIVGLATMILVASVAVIPFVGDAQMREPVITVGVLLAGLVLGVPVYFSRTVRDSGLGRWLKARVPFAGVLRDLDGVMHSMKHSTRTLLAAMGLSLVIQAWVIGVSWLMALEMGMSPMPALAQFFLFEPIIFIITAIPVSVGGWGVQEGAFVHLFGFAGVPPNEAIALSLLVKTGLLVASLPGGLLFMLGVGRKKPGAVE
jgi:hypothetical protein